jgi:flagellar biogenesis protein FliO
VDRKLNRPLAALTWLVLGLVAAVGLGAEQANVGGGPAAAGPARLTTAQRHRPLAPASHQVDSPLAISKPGRIPARATGAVRSLLGLFAALGGVIALLLATLWILRRLLPKDQSLLPAEVFEVLGRRPLLGRQQAQVVRFGNKLVLLAVSPLGAEPLAQIDEAAEVERLAALCRRPAAGGATTAFRQMFHQLAREPAGPGFVGEGQARALELAVRELGQGQAREASDA